MSTIMPLKILLVGASGVPGRNILASLLAAEYFKFDLIITKRKTSRTQTFGPHAHSSFPFKEFYVDYDNPFCLSDAVTKLTPDIIISAINAEPEPHLDTRLFESLTEITVQPGWQHPLFFINGFTLDIKDPSVLELDKKHLETLAPKIALADLLHKSTKDSEDPILNKHQCLEYATIVNASFLDYTLVKGYNGIELDSKTAVIYGGGNRQLTGCSTQFVGDAVVEVVRQRFFGTPNEAKAVTNKRVRIAETTYTGLELLAAVEDVTGEKLERKDESLESLLESGRVVSYLNWKGKGASTFVPDGINFGAEGPLQRRRRTLKEIVKVAVAEGKGAFEGIGR